MDSAETYEILRKEINHPGVKKRRRDSQMSPTQNLEFSLIQETNNCSTPKSHLNNSFISVKSITPSQYADCEKFINTICETTDFDEIGLDENLEDISPNVKAKYDNNLSTSKLNKTESPTRDKHIFKTPTRLNMVRRSLRLKTSNVLTRWLSNLDVNLGSKTDTLNQQIISSKNGVSNETEGKEESHINELVL